MNRLYGPTAAEPPRLVSSNDLAGLSTRDADDLPVGELYGTLAEESTGLIRYLDVAVRDSARHVLVPIGHTRIERDAVPPRVRLRAATNEDLLSIPEFDPEATSLDMAYQDEVVHAHGRLFYGSRYYAHPAFEHGGLYAGEAPIAGPEADGAAPAEPRLRTLGELPDYRVSKGEPDVRSWPLIDEYGERAGEVFELLVDLAARKVRYVVVSLEDVERTTALPVGYLEVDREAGVTCTPNLTREDLRVLPAYESPLTRREENRINAAIEGRLTGERYFDRPDFRRP